MSIHNLKWVFIIMILFIAGCIKEKDELTLPVRIKLQIAALPLQENYFLYAFEGKIGIKSIQFEGKREAGEDIFFETDPKMNLQTLQLSSKPTGILEFEIPQGIYNYMRWDLTLKSIMTEELNNVGDADSLRIGLVIPGSYWMEDWTDEWGWDISITPFIFGIDDTELFSFKSTGIDGRSGIVITDRKTYEITLLLDLQGTFGSVSWESFAEAELTDANGQQIILITSDKNKNLYENFLYRTSQSAKVFIK
jgi:hypothetical protein